MLTDSQAGVQSLGAILLAAGESSRLGQPKQLLEIDGEPLVVRQARLLAERGYARVVVVTGAFHEEVSALLEKLPVRCVNNPHWKHGMGKSLACGIGSMPERVRAALVSLCDQWKIEAGDLQALLDAWSENPKAAVTSAYDQVTGPPAILPRSLFEKLSRLKGDAGANRVLKRWSGELIQLSSHRAAFDIDTHEQIPQ